MDASVKGFAELVDVIEGLLGMIKWRVAGAVRPLGLIANGFRAIWSLP